MLSSILIAFFVSSMVAICVGKHAKTILGNTFLREKNYAKLAGHRVAVMSNPTGVFATDMVHIVDDMHSVVTGDNSPSFEFVLILGPEHGFRGEKQAETGDAPYYVDDATGLPVLSAYALSVAQLRDALQTYNITAVVVDIQDVGVRLYTFIWTMYNVMDAFAQISQTPNVEYKFFVCDRPNPNGGDFVDGPMLNMSFASGYGRAPIPFIHGMTIGELSLLFNTYIHSIIDIEVLPMKNWERGMSYYETGLPWIPPSPNVPTVFSAEAYAATVFLEATTISEGRGTCTPFTLFGAPFLSGVELASRLNTALNCTGGMSQSGISHQSSACFRAAYFQPTFQKYNGSVVQGVQYLETPYLSQRSEENGIALPVLRDFRSATIMLQTLISLSTPQSSFQWDGSWFGHPGTELIDQYAGSDQYRLMLDAGLTVDEIVAYFQPATDGFRLFRQQFLLY